MIFGAREPGGADRVRVDGQQLRSAWARGRRTARACARRSCAPPWWRAAGRRSSAAGRRRRRRRRLAPSSVRAHERAVLRRSSRVHHRVGRAQRGDGLRVSPVSGPSAQAAAAGVEGLLELAELGGGRVAEQPLARDPVPVGGRLELAEHAERERLHAAGEHRLRRHRLAAHQLPVVASAGRRSRSGPAPT